MLELTNEQWRQVRDEVVELKDSFIWSVIADTFEQERKVLLHDLDLPKTPENTTNFLRGGRHGLKYAIMVLDRLRKSADSHLSPSKRRKKDDIDA